MDLKCTASQNQAKYHDIEWNSIIKDKAIPPVSQTMKETWKMEQDITCGFLAS